MAPTVAIAGPTGKLGEGIVAAFTSSLFRNRFANIILLSRHEDLSVPGCTTRPISYDVSIIKQSLKDVDVVVNALSTSAYGTKRALVTAISQTTSAQLYFPSEFGVDHQLPGPEGQRGTDADFAHGEWAKKKALRTETETLFAEAGRHDVKICHVYCSLMLEISLGPWFGLSVKNRHFEAAGSVDEKVSWTSIPDIGRAVAALSLLPLDKVPSDVRISGDAKSIREVAQILDEVAVDGQAITVENVDVEEKRRHAREKLGRGDPASFIVLSMGTGKLDFSSTGRGNNNELINPGEQSWRWKTVKDYAEETKGRPYAEW